MGLDIPYSFPFHVTWQYILELSERAWDKIDELMDMYRCSSELVVDGGTT